MGEIRDYRDLVVWQLAMDLVVRAYALARRLPPEELHGLTSQMRRAAVSIPANIAEGHGRSGTKEYLHHLSIAHGSLMELETHFQIAERLGHLTPELTGPALEATHELAARLKALMNKLRERAAR